MICSLEKLPPTRPSRSWEKVYQTPVASGSRLPQSMQGHISLFTRLSFLYAAGNQTFSCTVSKQFRHTASTCPHLPSNTDFDNLAPAHAHISPHEHYSCSLRNKLNVCRRSISIRFVLCVHHPLFNLYLYRC